jgi:steroid 5-alpha reductase family enzyme
MFKYTRNPNYLGEMMIYGSFALLANHWFCYFIILTMWGVFFNLNMILKDSDSL